MTAAPPAHRLVTPDGATAFGPLPDEVRIGAAASCGLVLHPSLGAPALALVLRREPGEAWRVSLPGVTPYPCRRIRGDVPRPLADGDVLRTDDVLELTGPDGSVLLRLTAGDAPAPAAAVPPPAPAAPTAPRLSQDLVMIGAGLLAVLVAAGSLLAVWATVRH